MKPERPEPNTETLHWVDWRGKERPYEVNLTVDLRNFEGRAGLPHLLMAANPHLSYQMMRLWLKRHGIERPASWLQKRRWMYHPSANSGTKPNPDGRDAKAIAIMRANPRLSLRDLVLTLKDNGIARSREWVRQHRCDNCSPHKLER